MKARPLVLTAVLIVASLMGVPYLIKYSLQNQLLALGAEQASIEDIDLNPFSGEIVIKGLSLTKKGERILTLVRARGKIDWLPLSKHRILIQALQIEGLSTAIEVRENGETMVAGLTFSPSKDLPKDSASPWLFSIKNAHLKRIKLRTNVAKNNYFIAIDSLKLNNLWKWFPRNKSNLELNAKVNGSPLLISAQFTPFESQPHYRIHIDLTQFKLPPQQHLSKDLASLKGKLSLHSQLDISQRNGHLTVQHDGQITLYDLLFKTHTDGAKIKTTLAALTLDGKAQYITGKQPLFKLQANIELERLHIGSEQRKMELVKLEQAMLNNLSINHLGRVHSDSITIKDLVLGTPQVKSHKVTVTHPSLFHIDSLTLSPLSFLDHHLQIKSLALSGGYTSLKRHKNGSWNAATMQKLLTDLSPKTTQESTEATSEQALRPVTMSIDTLAINDHHTLFFSDQRTIPPFSLETDITQFNVTNINSQKSQQQASLALAGTLEKYGEFSLKGRINPFLPKLTTALEIQIKGLDLPVFSPYVAPAIGVQVKSGLLTSKVDVTVNEDVLKSVADITLRQFEMGNLTKAQKTHMSEGADMTLNTALEVLRDKYNTIHLRIPINGNIHAPEFNANDAIRQASLKAAKVGAMKYLTLALQPYGSLITVAKLAGSQLVKLRLNPVTFPSDSNEITEEAKTYLKKVSGIMTERPHLSIKICGFSTSDEGSQAPLDKKPLTKTPHETDATYPYLTTLAKQRADRVKRYLIETLNAPKDHLAGCLPEIDLKKNSVGRVELFI